jgi:CRISPR-associated protein Cas1
MLNEFVYCPRLFYYEHVEGVFIDNADTLRGAAIHKRVDSGKGALPAPPSSSTATAAGDEAPARTDDAETPDPAAPPATTLHSRSISLGSDRLGVTAKLDLVEIAPDPATGAPASVSPVDYKAGAPREGSADSDGGGGGPMLWDADRMQLGLQMLLLRDNGYPCTEGVIYYRATRQRVPLALTPELETWVLAQIEAARRTAAGPIPPPLVDSPKCPRCSLVPICLPDETRLMREGPVAPEAEEPEAGAQTVFDFDGDFAAARPPPPATVGEAGPGERLRKPRPARRLIAPRPDTRPLYVSTAGCSLGRKSELIVVRHKNEVVQEVRISDVDHVAIFGPATISTALVQTLAEKDIPVTYFSLGGWFYGLTRGHSLKNVFTRIEQFAVANDRADSMRYARAFVHGKLRNQRTFLMRNHVQPEPLVLDQLRHAAGAALRATGEEELLGIEGAGAAAYYGAFPGLVKLEQADDPTQADRPGQAFFNFDFVRRNRRPPRDAVNALLSLAYSLLARDCTIAAHAVGLDPYIGFYHRPRFGRPALALDLMEEFRPIVADSVVITTINNRQIEPGDFVRAGDAVNLSPAGRKKFLMAYERRMAASIVHPVFDYQVSYRRGLELQARLLGKALTGEIEAYTPFLVR